MALSKERKQELLDQYKNWVESAEAIVFAEYTGMTMPAFDTLRATIREAGGEFHVLKNTLAARAFEAAGFDVPPETFLQSTAIGIAYEDAPAIAKAIKDFGKTNEAVKIKGGIMDGKFMSADSVTALADLPPLPVVRGQLLGVINAPATKLARTLKEPGRSLAQVIKAYGDQGAAAAA